MTDFMTTLSCRVAVNLASGGSTKLWISGKPLDGVVKVPYDNIKFDHERARAVSDILIVK